MSLPVLIVALAMCVPGLCLAQASPFMTGASALQTNILAWLTPIAIILIMVLGGMAMANRMGSRTRSRGCANSAGAAVWAFNPLRKSPTPTAAMPRRLWRTAVTR
jgi:hypothetical protein